MTSEFRGKTNELDSEEDQYNGREKNPRKTKNFLHLLGDKMMTKTQEKHFHRQNKKSFCAFPCKLHSQTLSGINTKSQG